MVETSEENEYFLLSRHSKKEIKIHKIKTVGFVISVTVIITSAFYFVLYLLLHKDKYDIIVDKDSLYLNWEDDTDGLLKEFTFLNPNNVHGPITINRKQDDRSKQNIYSMITNPDSDNDHLENNENDYDTFNNLPKELSKNSEYFCQLNEKIPPDVQKGNNIQCPVYYTLSIDYASYGRFNNDTIQCSKNTSTVQMPTELLYTPIDCINNVTEVVKEQCEGKEECTLKPNDHFYGENEKCKKIYKYLHVQYHCVKDTVNR